MSADKRAKNAPRPGGFNGDGLCVAAVYKNTLPQPPFPSKFLSVRELLPQDRFVRYTQQTSLEKEHKPKLLVGQNVGVEVDLIDDLMYIPDSSLELHPNDKVLLADDLAHNKRSKIARPAVHTKVHIPWLRKTTYISTENKSYGKGGGGGGENKVFGRQIEEKDIIILSREQQIDAIEKTFQDAAKCNTIRHPLNPNLTIANIKPLLPDYTHWGKDFCQGTFDVDPQATRDDIPDDLQRHYTTQALLIDADHVVSDDPVASMYLPTKKSFESRKRRRESDEVIKPGENYDYVKVRDYLIKIQNKEDMGGMELFSFCERDTDFQYLGLDRTIRFTRRRTIRGEQTDSTRVKLIVEHKEVEDGSFDAKRPVFFLEAEALDEAEAKAAAENESTQIDNSEASEAPAKESVDENDKAEPDKDKDKAEPDKDSDSD